MVFGLKSFAGQKRNTFKAKTPPVGADGVFVTI
jgi:hypothetical protein